MFTFIGRVQFGSTKNRYLYNKEPIVHADNL